MNGQMNRRIPRRPDGPLHIDRELWWHAFDAALAGVIVLVAAWWVPARVPLGYVIAPMAGLTFVIWLVTRWATGVHALPNWLLAMGVTLTAWTAYARIAGVWSEEVLAWLLLAVVVLAPFGPPAIASYRAAGRGDAYAEDRAKQRAELKKWEKKFSEWGARGVRVTRLRQHTAGWEVYGTLTRSEGSQVITTFDWLKDNLPAVIVTDLGLAPGAASFEQLNPDNAAEFVMHLFTKKGKRTVKHLPETARRASINDPLELGEHDNGHSWKLLLREIAVLIAGVIGSGKSNLLNVIIGQAARCEDVLIFCIDLKGGRMARAWMMPWVEGLTTRPVIDWLAVTREEALRMLRALRAGGDARARQSAGGEKIRPSRKRPGVLIIMDESAVATGHERKDDGVKARDIARELAMVVETFRSEGFVPVVATVRADVETMGMTAFKAQSLCRIGLRVSQSRDGESVFPDDNAAAKALTRIRDEGAGLALLKGHMFPPVHFFRVTTKIAYYRALLTGSVRPAPDEYLEAAMNTVLDDDGRGAYEARWDRMAATIAAWQESAHEWRHDPDVGIGEVEPAARKAASAVLEREREQPAPGGGSDLDRQFSEIVANLEDPEGDGDTGRRLMRELLRASPRGYTVGALVKVLRGQPRPAGAKKWPPHRNTLTRWLRDDEQIGQVRRQGGQLGDPYATWTWIRQPGEDLLGGREQEDLP